jgi:predicted RNA-binding protein with PUA-like domain
MAWLLKTEPSEYSFGDLVRDRKTAWSGVKNAVAVKNLREMKAGDPVVIYHTGAERAAVGLAEVVSAPRFDPEDPKSAIVDIEAVRPLESPVSLEALKTSPLFKDSPLVKIGRLSVVPLTPRQYAFLARR